MVKDNQVNETLDATEAEASQVAAEEPEIASDQVDSDESEELDEDFSDENMFDFEGEETEDELPEDEDGTDEEPEVAEETELEQPEPEQSPAAPAKEVNPDLAYYDQITATAIARVQEITGQEYDEFDTKHKVILMREAEKAANVIDGSRKAHAEAAEIIKANGGEKLQAFIGEQLNKVTKGEYDAMIKAEAKGDYSKTIAFMKKAAQEFKLGSSAKQKAATINNSSSVSQSTPPKTMGSGTGSTPRSKKLENAFSLKDLGLPE